MSFEQNLQGENNEVVGFIKSLYAEIMSTHKLLIKLRKEKKVDKIEETKILLDGLKEDYDSLVKTHTSYMRMTKLTGNSKETSLAEMARLLQEIKSNVGGIVQSVPVIKKEE